MGVELSIKRPFLNQCTKMKFMALIAAATAASVSNRDYLGRLCITVPNSDLKDFCFGKTRCVSRAGEKICLGKRGRECADNGQCASKVCYRLDHDGPLGSCK